LATQVSEPLSKSLESLDQLRQTLNLAADTSKLLPSMLGSQGERNYLLLLQNNAEVRATGGLPGALAVLQVENGNIRFANQSSGSSLGRFRPPIAVDPEQTVIYTSRLGSYISDVNLTPDFPTAAKTAKSMWEERHGTRIDGVIALDAVALSHILKISGPISVPVAQAHATAGLPQTLTEDNVVRTLLSDVYKQLGANELQDAYFASATEAIFKVLTSGKVPGQGLVTALTTSLDENRLRVWSDHKEEQELLYRNRVGGSISGPSMGGATFGIYFNDGTGAKMDFYMKRTVQMAKQCPVDGYSEVKVKVTTSNTAPPDAATRLPAAVTGGGLHGVPPGTVQTNIIAYGPAQAHIETAHQDGAKTPFASYFDHGRPVGVLATKLQPGQSTTVEFTFGKIVQTEEPTLVMTPTVQSKDDVVSSIVGNCS
jgi:hypothetical protein